MALVSPPSSPTIELRRCEALLIDEETCCNVPIRFTRGRFCNAHGREYVQLTQAYKSVSKTVEELKKTACLTRPQMRALQHTVEVDMAIGLAKEWREAIAEEIRGRQVQHRRFFVTWDKGHQQWLDHLALSETKAEDLIAQLRTRRAEIVDSVWCAHVARWREAEAASNAARVEEQRRRAEAHRVRVDAYNARSSTAATASLTWTGTTEADRGIGRTQRPSGYVVRPSPQAAAEHHHPPGGDLENQAPVVIHAGTERGDGDGGIGCFALLLIILLLWVLSEKE